ncbi:hypothetical protein H0H87_000848 [Tephrocybe sp. NHM501043]|nr:hypothetical protein H0H87_000848 [Tephrocybe sp. NHM501043]
MSTRRVVVDDADSRIQYSGSWFTQAGQNSLGNDGPTYLGSQHGLKGNGGFTFTFDGTSIELFGTNGQVPASDGYDPKWGCKVDGESVSSRSGSSEAENNWPLCGRDGLSAGTHQLSVDVQGSGQGTFWFDRLMYTPSGSPPSGSVMWVDATKDSAFQYDNTWHSSGVMVTAVNGGAVSFSFTGSGLTWVGEVPDHSEMSPASLTYAIDGGNAATVKMVGKANENSPTQHNHVFFSTPDISPGSHTIKVTYNGNSNTPLTAGYVYVQNQVTQSGSSSPPAAAPAGSDSSQSSTSPSQSDSHSSVSASGASSASSPASSAAHISPSFNSTWSSNSTSSVSSQALASGSALSPQGATSLSGPSSPPIGSNLTTPSHGSESPAHSTSPWIIVAGVLGGIVLILLILLFFFMRRRRQRRLPLASNVGNLTPFTARNPPTYNDSMVKLVSSTNNLPLNNESESVPSDQTTVEDSLEVKTAAGPSSDSRHAVVSLGAPPSYTK